MAKRQFRVLYREFLFRMMDVELLAPAAQGDSNQLLGQFASLLILVSVVFSLGAMGFGGKPRPPEVVASQIWSLYHIMTATTMLVVGLFAVLSWDSTFPDRRDVLVMAPLPVRPRTMFLAKVAAVAAALGLTVLLLNSLSGVLLPLAMVPPGSGLLGAVRFFAAYWIALCAGGAFIYCAILGVQGIAAQLPRGWFLRLSSFLQLAAFGLLVSVYCLQPQLAGPRALAAPGNQGMLAWLPSYWFLGLFSEISGAFPPEFHVLMAPLARRALAGLGVAVLVAAVAFVLSYFRTLRKIVEEPDILPGARGGFWLPRFGSRPQTALVQFCIRTLMRSRQHRVIVAFYLGFGLAVATLYMNVIRDRARLDPASVLRQTNLPMLVSSFVMLIVWIMGTRVVFSIPLDLKANWLFRVMPVRGGRACLTGTRRALLTLSVVPVWIGCGLIFLWVWPWRTVAAHLLVFGLMGSILADACLYGFRKIPFTCSFLPGKSKVHLAFWICTMLVVRCIEWGAGVERQALDRPASYAAMIVVLCAVAAAARWLSATYDDEPDVQFEEFPSDELVVLGLGTR